MCAKQVLTKEDKKDALQHEAERAAADAKQEAVQARSNAQAFCTPYAQEVGGRQNTESQMAQEVAAENKKLIASMQPDEASASFIACIRAVLSLTNPIFSKVWPHSAYQQAVIHMLN